MEKDKSGTSNGMEEEPLEDENSLKDGSYYAGDKKSGIMSPIDDNFSEIEVKETVNSNRK